MDSWMFSVGFWQLLVLISLVWTSFSLVFFVSAFVLELRTGKIW